MIGKTILQFCDENGYDCQQIETLIEKARNGEEAKAELQTVNRKGEVQYRDVTFYKAEFLGQEVLISYGHEAYDRKLTEKMLRENEGKFRILADQRRCCSE